MARCIHRSVLTLIMTDVVTEFTIAPSAVRPHTTLFLTASCFRPTFDSQTKEALTSAFILTRKETAALRKFARQCLEELPIEEGVLAALRSKERAVRQKGHGNGGFMP